MNNGHQTRSRYSLRSQEVDLSINEDQRLAIVGAGVTMEQLVKATLAHGLVPLVVPEFKSITVGGAIAGGALESSSFRYGQFHDTCMEYAILCRGDDLITASPHLNSHLFHALSGSYGLFGRVSKAVVALQEAHRGVRLRYTRCTSSAEAVALVRELATAVDPPDYLDGVGLSPECWIVMEGVLCDDAEGVRGLSISHVWSEWYADHLTSGVAEEWMPIQEYLFRYDRGAFWMGRYLVQPWHQIPAAIWEWLWSRPELAKRLSKEPSYPSRWFRALFGWLTSSEMLYRQLHHLDGDYFFIQDAYLPIERAEEVIQWSDELLGIYPIWLCPLEGTQEPQLLSPSYQRSPLLLNVGLYGAPEGNIRELTTEFEQMVALLGGRKMLYGLNTYTPERFWEIYDRYVYEQLRERYGIKEIHLSRSSHTFSSSQGIF